MTILKMFFFFNSKSVNLLLLLLYKKINLYVEKFSPKKQPKHSRYGKEFKNSANELI